MMSKSPFYVAVARLVVMLIAVVVILLPASVVRHN